jgi:hypothetical protein
MGFSYGLHIKSGYDLPAMLTSPELDNVYSGVVQVRTPALACLNGSHLYSTCCFTCAYS